MSTARIPISTSSITYNFTWSANTATCAHGTRVSGVLAARDNGFGVVGMLPGAPITAVKVVSCHPIISWTSRRATRRATRA